MRRRGCGATEVLGREREELDHSTHEEKRIENSGLLPSNKRVFILCLVFRVINSLLVQTYFNPDEHWQALEVAHRITFGYGHLTWEWKKGLRSYLHPLVFALLYKFLHLCNLDTPTFMARAPRMLQSLFCAIGDLYIYRFSYVLFGQQVARWAVSFSYILMDGYHNFLIGAWIYGEQRSASRKCALVLAALACAVRPTSAVIWLYVGVLEVLLTRDKLRFIFLETIPVGAVVLMLASLLDRLFYGLWVLVPLNFLKFNFLSSGGDYYGTHVWHWYFTQGFSGMLFTFVPFVVAGIFQSKYWKLFGCVPWVLGFYSVLGHKEFRFPLNAQCCCFLDILWQI